MKKDKSKIDYNTLEILIEVCLDLLYGKKYLENNITFTVSFNTK